MHRLQHLDDAVRLAAVEVVDVEHDPVDARQLVLDLGGRIGEQLAHAAEVVVDPRDEAELRPVVALGRAARGETGEPPACAEVGYLFPELARPLLRRLDLRVEVGRADVRDLRRLAGPLQE